MQKRNPITEKMRTNICELKNYAERLSATCDAILNGTPITVACDDTGLNIVRFRHMANYGFAETKQIPVKSDNISYALVPTPEEALWLSVMQKKFTDMPAMPDKLEEIWPIAFKTARLTQKETDILYEYYWNDMSDTEIGKKQNVSRQYINLRRKDAENKLRIRAANVLTYGLSYQIQLEDLRQKCHEQANKYVREHINRIQDNIAEALFSKTSKELDIISNHAVAAITCENAYMNPDETIPVQNAALSKRAETALINNGIHTLQQLNGKTKRWLMELPNVGVKTANEIKSAADRFGVTIQ